MVDILGGFIAMDNVFTTMIGQLNGATRPVPESTPALSAASHAILDPAVVPLLPKIAPIETSPPVPTDAPLPVVHFRVPPPDTLTAAERRILEHVVQAKTDKEIGQALSLSPFTIADGLKRIMRKTEIYSRVALTAHFAPLDPNAASQRALLTRREQEIINWVALGKTDEVIGQIVSLSPATVGDHLKNAMQKTGRHRRALLALLADPPITDSGAARPGTAATCAGVRPAARL